MQQLELQLAVRIEPEETWAVTVPARITPRRRLPVIPLPKTRAACKGEGICPKFSCRYNVTLEVTKGGRLRMTASNGARGEQPSYLDADDSLVERIVEWLEGVDLNCALDIAEAYGGLTLEEVADRLGLVKQAVATSEWSALLKMANHPDGRRLLELFRARMEAGDARESALE